MKRRKSLCVILIFDEMIIRYFLEQAELDDGYRDSRVIGGSPPDEPIQILEEAPIQDDSPSLEETQSLFDDSDSQVNNPEFENNQSLEEEPSALSAPSSKDGSEEGKTISIIGNGELLSDVGSVPGLSINPCQQASAVEGWMGNEG